jgi:hypothetical protein
MIEAPRWRLINAHYLRVPELPDGTKIEWEHKETARESGRTIRKLFPVPMLLDPKDPADCNYPGELIVAHAIEGANNLRNDYIFLGEPTQEMEPLNDAAQAITDSLQAKWVNPIETLPINGGMSSDERVFMEKMMQSFAREIGTALPKANLAVPNDEVDELKERLAKLEALLASQTKAAPEPTGRRV